ncbi:zf-HC2 domain-containing protein [Puerhibacterium puerhi]|uniref:zf-HC2 domain-containing protein n=1 Tax=Puerhibacterium puerhi TaxID=2692623 RepID=UPI0013597511|nr:zf-HC2 domain-containing protein [Puerhibacterium puerhi]
MARRNPVAGLALGDFLDRSPVERQVRADPGVLRTAVAGVDERTRTALLVEQVTSPAWIGLTTVYARASERRHPSTAHVLDLLPAYLMRRLRLRERDLVTGHLNACPDCDRVLRELQDLPRAWAALGDAVVVGPLEARPARAPGRLAPLLQSIGDRLAYAVDRARTTVRPAVWGAVAAGLVLGGGAAVAIGSATAEQRRPAADPVPVTTATTPASTVPSPAPASPSPSPSPSPSASASPSPSGVPSSSPDDDVRDAPLTGARDDGWRPTGGAAGGRDTSDGGSGTGSGGGSQTGTGGSTGTGTGGSAGGGGQQSGGGSGGTGNSGDTGGQPPGDGTDTGDTGGQPPGGDTGTGGTGDGTGGGGGNDTTDPGSGGTETPTTPPAGGGTPTPDNTGGPVGGGGGGTGSEPAPTATAGATVVG